ncbi:hypothetical protein [Methylorubrum sp. POS3]|uniref:hypothetical protein n=1 Tax=Methylorubrum sp. POS3 TaxID=2998492 RepID=UPI0037270207
MSDSLVHLTKVDWHKWNASVPSGKCDMENEAFFTLLKILKEKKLRSHDGMIKGRYKCVCFSETPIMTLQQLFDNNHDNFRYRPFGIIFKKKYIFDKGGRPVIYQPADDFEKLHEDHQHLHVTYDLKNSPSIDFTWEREWRFRSDTGIELTKECAEILVPNNGIRKLIGRYLRESTKAADDPWNYVVLDQYGVKVSVPNLSIPET